MNLRLLTTLGLATLATVAQAQQCRSLPLPDVLRQTQNFESFDSLSPSGRHLVIEAGLPGAAREPSNGFEFARDFLSIDLQTGQTTPLSSGLNANLRGVWANEDTFVHSHVNGTFTRADLGQVILGPPGLLCRANRITGPAGCLTTSFRQQNPTGHYTANPAAIGKGGWFWVNEAVYNPAQYPAPITVPPTPQPPALATRTSLINLITGEEILFATLLGEIQAATGVTLNGTALLSVLASADARRIFFDSGLILQGPQAGQNWTQAQGNVLQVNRQRYFFDRDTRELLPVAHIRVDVPIASIPGYLAGSDNFPFFQLSNDASSVILLRRAPVADLPNGNPDFSWELYRWRRDAPLQQLTNVAGPVAGQDPNVPDPGRPITSGNGRFGAFFSRRDFAGRNADGSLEVFRIDSQTGRIIQLTDRIDRLPAVAARFNLTPAQVNSRLNLYPFAISDDGLTIAIGSEGSTGQRNFGATGLTVSRGDVQFEVIRCDS